MDPSRKILSYEEALELFPRVRHLTEAAVARIEPLLKDGTLHEPVIAEADLPSYETIVREWVSRTEDLGAEVKGLWLVDFDSGSGYYCWRYPEPTLEYFHGYEEGFEGRVKLN